MKWLDGIPERKGCGPTQEGCDFEIGGIRA